MKSASGGIVGGAKKILAQLFEKPTRADIAYEAAISLLQAQGAIVKEGSGSRVKIFIRGKVIQFHRPHQKELPRYVVEDIRDTLAELGISPK